MIIVPYCSSIILFNKSISLTPERCTISLSTIEVYSKNLQTFFDVSKYLDCTRFYFDSTYYWNGILQAFSLHRWLHVKYLIDMPKWSKNNHTIMQKNSFIFFYIPYVFVPPLNKEDMHAISITNLRFKYCYPF